MHSTLSLGLLGQLDLDRSPGQGWKKDLVLKLELLILDRNLGVQMLMCGFLIGWEDYFFEEELVGLCLIFGIFLCKALVVRGYRKILS